MGRSKGRMIAGCRFNVQWKAGFLVSSIFLAVHDGSNGMITKSKMILFASLSYIIKTASIPKKIQ